MVRPAALFEFDESTERLTMLELGSSPGATVDVHRVRHIAGAYEVHGWSPYSTIYAVGEDGARVPLVAFSGSGESLPVEACRVLGEILRRPAAYSGQYGTEPRP